MMNISSEQKIAINHSGGVLLNAGAGSGKTAVLVEHLILLIDNCIKDYSKENLPSFSNFFRSRFSRVVFMTFTNKAADEIYLRIKARIEKKKQESSYWEIVKTHLDVIKITTIHGFCLNLLKQGFFSQVGSHIEVLSKSEWEEHLRGLYLEWIEFKKQNKQQKELLETLIHNENSMTSALQKIFENPTLRLAWKESTDQNKAPQDLWPWFKEILKLNDLQALFEEVVPLKSVSDQDYSEIYELLDKFQKLRQIEHFDHDTFKLYQELFSMERWKRVPKKLADDLAFVSFYEKLQSLREILKTHKQSLEAYFCYPSIVTQWTSFYQELIAYTEENYLRGQGFSFADMEYYVLLGLQEESIRKKIAAQYNYIVIDEFQDTSHIQFEIIQKILNYDLDKLFCVGDVKQAIYGFRGGELEVFRSCEKKIKSVLFLKDNYRSVPDIIKFNNFIFKSLLNKGKDFKGIDSEAIPVVLQKSVKDSEKSFALRKVLVKTQNEYKDASLDKLESHAIAQSIYNLKQQYPEDEIAVLFKNLGPSRDLILILMQDQISFTAQIKIPYQEDPLIGIFHILLQSSLDKKENITHYAHKIICCYLDLLKLQIPSALEIYITSFFNDILLYGMMNAYRKFLFKLNFSNAHYHINMQELERVCRLYGADKENVLKKIEEKSSDRYSTEIYHGETAHKIKIMTTHNAKGLQFKHVILGGIQNNGRRKPEQNYVGKLPASFKWKKNTSQKTAYSSPYFILENMLSAKTDFAESKRLFYVACTRAEKTLTWVDILGASPFSSSWIKGLRAWEEEGMTSQEREEKELLENINKFKIEIDLELKTDKLQKINPPFFHKNSLGIYPKKGQEPLQMAFLPELSVTRLATVVDCPRKFYLKNVCQLEEAEKVVIEKLIQDKFFKKIEREQKSVLTLEHGSQAERGTNIHSLISKMIEKNHTIPLDVSLEEKKILMWVKSQLEVYLQDYNLFSEHKLKFSLFNYMMTGIPDLFLVSKKNDQISYIWDFKTGRRDIEKEPTYIFQLLCYAYALYQLKIIEEADKVRIILAYVDQELREDKELNFLQIKGLLFQEWQKVVQLDQINTKHCQKCEYGNICHT